MKYHAVLLSSSSGPEVLSRGSACLPGLQDDAKLAFKQLMGSVGMGSDWGWDQTLRLIASDPRRVLQPVEVPPLSTLLLRPSI